MFIANKATVISLAGLLVTATSVFAQVGGGSEMPSEAKSKAGATNSTADNKTTQDGGSMSKGAMKNDNGSMMKHDGMDKSGGKM